MRTRLISGVMLWAFSVLSIAAGSTASSKPSATLASLGDAFYLEQARFDPVNNATLLGDNRFDDQLNITISPAERNRHFTALRHQLKQLHRIKREKLNDADALTYDLLDYSLRINIGFEQFPDHLLPVEQMDAMPIVLANFGTGQAEQPLRTIAQYEAYRKRLMLLPGWNDQAISNMREGIRRGIVQPRAIALVTVKPLKDLTVAIDDNPFYAPIKNLPATFTAAEKEKLAHEYTQTVQQQVIPSMNKLADFFEKEYLPASRATDGWSAMPNGAAWYKQWVAYNTTTDLDPDQIHEMGLKEVSRIHGELAKLAPQLGYTGDPALMLAWMRTNPRFLPFKSEKEILDAYRAINEKVKIQLPRLFGRMPKADLDILPEPELTRATASDHYSLPSEDGSRPGIFWAVINDPAEYNSSTMASLFLHEGQPGHHFQLSLQQEMPLPQFRKHALINSYAEGWALYAETLGHEIGLYDDPAMYAGNLRLEMMRAVRLVVDTGIHYKGWTHDRAIKYMMDNTGYSEAQSRNQIERYMVWPAQALSYKLGAMKIQELRERARQKLGNRFSLAAFHDAVLAEGPLPLSVLDNYIDHWIELQQQR